VTSDGVGDKIVEAGGMPQDACDYVMVCLNTLAFLLFFLATLQSLVNYIIASECIGFEETEQWVQGMGGRMRSHLPGCHLRSDQECASSLPSEAQCWAGQQGATRGNQGNTG